VIADEKDNSVMRVSKSVTETQMIDFMEEDGEGEEPGEQKGLAWQNMNSTVEGNKEGPWYTQPAHMVDENERRPDHPDYDPSTLHIP